MLNDREDRFLGHGNGKGQYLCENLMKEARIFFFFYKFRFNIFIIVFHTGIKIHNDVEMSMSNITYRIFLL